MNNRSIFIVIVHIIWAASLSGCVSLAYQQPDNVSKLKTKLDESPSGDKQMAAEFIERKLKFIKTISTNKDILETESISVNGAKIWIKTKDNGVCTIYFSGQMTSQSELAFYQVAKFALSHKCKDVLLKLSSGGGLVNVGIGIGLTANNFGWSTVAWRTNPYDLNNILSCRSACGLAYLGGKKRYSWTFSMGSDAGHVGLNQFSRGNVCIVDPSDYSYTLLDKYLNVVFPEDPTLMMGKILNESCKRANYTFSPLEKLSAFFPDKYTHAIFEKYD